jgi:hypothetical protein
MLPLRGHATQCGNMGKTFRSTRRFLLLNYDAGQKNPPSTTSTSPFTRLAAAGARDTSRRPHEHFDLANALDPSHWRGIVIASQPIESQERANDHGSPFRRGPDFRRARAGRTAFATRSDEVGSLAGKANAHRAIHAPGTAHEDCTHPLVAKRKCKKRRGYHWRLSDFTRGNAFSLLVGPLDSLTYAQ